MFGQEDRIEPTGFQLLPEPGGSDAFVGDKGRDAEFHTGC
jgi:hypothetical protein